MVKKHTNKKHIEYSFQAFYIRSACTGWERVRTTREGFDYDNELHTLSHVYDVKLTDEDGILLPNWSELVVVSGDGISEAVRVNGDSVDVMLEKIALFRQSLAQCPTACLWFEFTDMVDTLCRSIEADCIGFWDLRLKATKEMLPIFAAAGNNHYVKAAYLELQENQELEEKNPTLYAKVKEGKHLLQTTAGKFRKRDPDTIIEQEVMKPTKSIGGLTHGGRMTDNQISLWTLSHGTSVSYCSSYDRILGVNNTNEYEEDRSHKEKGAARMARLC